MQDWFRGCSMAPHNPDGEYKCSFCGSLPQEVGYLIRGPGAIFICAGCVGICREILERRAAALERLKRSEPVEPTEADIARILGQTKPSARRESSMQVVSNERAVQLVYEVYLDIVNLGRFPVERLNQGAPYGRYATQADLVRELWARAGAVANFAVSAGLIRPPQMFEILRRFHDEHPEAPEGRSDET